MQRMIVFAFCLTIPHMAVSATSAGGDISELLKYKIRMVQHLALNPSIIKAVRYDASAVPLNPVDAPVAPQQELSDLEPADIAVSVDEAPNDIAVVVGERDHEMVIKRFVENNSAFRQVRISDGSGTGIAAYPEQVTSDETQLHAWRQSDDAMDKVIVGPLNYDENSGVISTYIAAPVLDRDKTIGSVLVLVKFALTQQ